MKERICLYLTAFFMVMGLSACAEGTDGAAADTGEMTGTVVTETAATGTAVERNYDESKLAGTEMGNTQTVAAEEDWRTRDSQESAGQDEDFQAYRDFMAKYHMNGINSTLLTDLTGDGRDELIVVSSQVMDGDGKPLDEDSEIAKEARKHDEDLGQTMFEIRNTVTEHPSVSAYPSIGYTGFNSMIEINVYTRREETDTIECLYESWAAYPHPGWNWLYLYHENGRDYLMQFSPIMWQGRGSYIYKIFSLSDTGEERTYRCGEENYGTVDVDEEQQKPLWERMHLFLNQVDTYRMNSIPLVEIGNDYFGGEYDSLNGRDYNYVIMCDELGYDTNE